MLAQVVSFIDRQVITLLVQPIRADLGISDTEMSLLMGLAFALFYVTMGVPIAWLSDRYSRRTIIATGIFLWSLATAACGLARSFGQLFLARIGVGVGEATLTPAAYSMIADYFPKQILGRAIGLYAVGVYLGAGLALILGGAAVRLITASGPVDWPLVGTVVPWQLTFMVVSIPGLLIVLLMMFTVREPQRQNLAEAKGDSIPVRDVAQFMWTNRGTFGSIFFGYATGGMAFYGFMFWVPEFIRRSYGWDISDAGMAFGTLLVVLGTTGTYAGGWFCDWLTARGYKDAALRSLAAFFAIAMPFMTITPLMAHRGPCHSHAGGRGVHAVPATGPVAGGNPVVHTQSDARPGGGRVLRDLRLLRHLFRGGIGGGGHRLRLPRRERPALLALDRLGGHHDARHDQPGPRHQALSQEPGTGRGLERICAVASGRRFFGNRPCRGRIPAMDALPGRSSPQALPIRSDSIFQLESEPMLGVPYGCRG